MANVRSVLVLFRTKTNKREGSEVNHYRKGEI